MPRGKAIRPQVPSDICQAQRDWIADQLAEHAKPRRRRPNPTARRLIHPGRDEPRQPRPRLIKHSHGGIPGARQRRSGLEKTLKLFTQTIVDWSSTLG